MSIDLSESLTERRRPLVNWLENLDCHNAFGTGCFCSIVCWPYCGLFELGGSDPGTEKLALRPSICPEEVTNLHPCRNTNATEVHLIFDKAAERVITPLLTFRSCPPRHRHRSKRSVSSDGQFRSEHVPADAPFG